MRVCVLGAGGLIGVPLCRFLLKAGHAVTGMTRVSPRPAGLERCAWLVGEPAWIRGLLEGGFWDVVFDLRAYRGPDVQPWVALAHALCRRWIHVSSIYVYRRWRDAWTVPDPAKFIRTPITETTPCEPSGEYGCGKAACETIWLEATTRHAAPVTVVRLPFVYGPGDRSGRGHVYATTICAHQQIALPDSGQHRIELLFSADAAIALIRLAELDRAAGGVFNMALGAPSTLRSHVEAIADALGERAEIVGMPGNMNAAAVLPFAFPMDIVLDPSRLLAAAGPIRATLPREGWHLTFHGGDL